MDLTSFLSRRRAEIEARLAELQPEVSALRTELAKLDAAEQAAARVDIASAPPPWVAKPPSKPRAPRAGSIKSWIMAALDNRPGGLLTEEVIVTIALIGGPTVQRSSITPQLSRLKQAALIMQTGRTWMRVWDALGDDDDPNHGRDEPEAELAL